MKRVYNIYCDESCHLEKDGQGVMVLGAVWCPVETVKNINREISHIKEEFSLDKKFEIKWTKVSPAKINFYLKIIEYFFNNADLHFRGIVVTDKSSLRHEDFDQDHNTWYYKMFFHLLKVIFNPQDSYRIYLDIKDTCSSRKIRHLHEVLCNNVYDFSHSIIERIQTVHSHEVEILQLADLLIGALSYLARKLNNSAAKIKIIERIKMLSGYTLKSTTLIREEKFNLLYWSPKRREFYESL